MIQLIQRILSLIIALGYIVFVIIVAPEHILEICIFLIFALALIWLPGDLVSVSIWGGSEWWYGWRLSPSPGTLLQLLGWLILVGLPVVLYFAVT